MTPGEKWREACKRDTRVQDVVGEWIQRLSITARNAMGANDVDNLLKRLAEITEDG